MDAFWYEGMQRWQRFENRPTGSCDARNSDICAVARFPSTMEVWYTDNGGGVGDAFWYDFKVKLFSAPIPSGGFAALGGWVTVIINENGHVRWNGDGHDSGADNYDYGVVAYLRPRAGSKLPPIVHVHQGRIAGTFSAGSRDDPWDKTMQNDLVGAHYNEYEGGTLELNTQYSSSVLNTLESVLNGAIKHTIGNLLDGAGLKIVLGVEIGSIVNTGFLVPGARILNGVL